MYLREKLYVDYNVGFITLKRLNMKYWLHRITGGDNALEFAHTLLFKHFYLSIGWSDFSNDAFVNDVKERGASALDEAIQKEGWGLPRNRWNLWRFIKGMSKGDIVVVPTWGVFSLFEIADDEVLSNESIDVAFFKDWNGHYASWHDDGYFYDVDDKCVDLGFYRKVKPVLLNIPRDGYADQELYSRMKIQQTNADISDLAESVENVRKAFEQKKAD